MSVRSTSGLVSFVQAMRASWHFGGASRALEPGSAMKGYARSLELLAHPGVDVEAPWCRSIIPLALSGFCQAAQRAGGSEKTVVLLSQWRPVCLRWMNSPINEADEQTLAWLDGLFQSMSHGGSIA